ncbi:MAG: aldo/keto reductase [Bacteroidia bacterium]|nr:aldo/keto reductase [Bacteroidia bacterium]MDW8157722.1 aldo/keto reductase [Bacteroidia bacterium]
MKYKLLGKSGLRVSELCLGTLTFGEEWGTGASREESYKIFDVFVEAGGNFIDTANYYTGGTSEKIVGECIARDRDKFVVATKYTLHNKAGDINSCGNHRKNLLASLEGSLSRMKTDYVDILYLHAWDFTTPVEEIMKTLDSLIQSRKVLYIGISDTPAWIVSQANTLASLRGWESFIALQIEYSLIERAAERDLIPMAKAFEMSILAWGALGSGLLTGKYNKNNLDNPNYRLKEGSRRFTERNWKITETVVATAFELGCKPSHVALNWIRKKNSQIIPIIGARSSSQLLDNITALNNELPDSYYMQLEEVSKIELGFPHDFLESDNIKQVIFGGTYELLESFRK